MIAKCNQGVIFEVADLKRTASCPKECPNRRFCKSKFFVPIQTTGNPVLTIDNGEVKPQPSEVKPPFVEEVKVEEPPRDFVMEEDPFAMFMSGNEEVSQSDEFSELEDSFLLHI